MGGITGGIFGGREKLIEGNCQKQSSQHSENPHSDLSCSPATRRQGVPPPTLLNVLVHTSHGHLPGGSLYQHLQFPCGAKLIRWLEPFLANCRAGNKHTNPHHQALWIWRWTHQACARVPSHHAPLFPHPQCPRQGARSLWGFERLGVGGAVSSSGVEWLQCPPAHTD